MVSKQQILKIIILSIGWLLILIGLIFIWVSCHYVEYSSKYPYKSYYILNLTVVTVGIILVIIGLIELIISAIYVLYTLNKNTIIINNRNSALDIENIQISTNTEEPKKMNMISKWHIKIFIVLSIGWLLILIGLIIVWMSYNNCDDFGVRIFNFTVFTVGKIFILLGLIEFMIGSIYALWRSTQNQKLLKNFFE